MKKYLAPIGLYSGFFALSFILSLLLTFDANIPASLVAQGARRSNINLTYEAAEIAGLFGLELRGVSIYPAGQAEASGLSLQKLRLSPGLLSIPGMISDARHNKAPRLSLDFSAWTGESSQRNVQGRIRLNPPGLLVGVTVANLPIDRLPFKSFVPSMPGISGKMNGRLLMSAKDRSKPETVDATLRLALFSCQLQEFTLLSLKVPPLKIGNGNLDVEIKGGRGTIKNFSLQEGDLPVNLSGSIALPTAPPYSLGRATVELRGSIQPTDEIKLKMPMISAIANNQYSYRGELSGIAPMLK